MADPCTRAERIACQACTAAAGRDTFELWCVRVVAALPAATRQRMDCMIPPGIKHLADTPPAEQREADGIADTVLALADDMLAAFSEDELHDVHDIYDWLVAQTKGIRTPHPPKESTDG